MKPEPTIEIDFGDGETSIEFKEEGVTTSACIKAVGARQYQLMTIPLLIESAQYLDVIEADRKADGSLKFCRVVKASNYQVYDYILPDSYFTELKLVAILKRVTAVGGYWERVFGGCLLICLPPEVDWNPTSEIIDA